MLGFDRIVKNFDFSVIIARYHHVTRTRITFAIFGRFVFLETGIGIEFGVLASFAALHGFRGARLQLIENQLRIGRKYRTSHQCVMR